MDSSGRFLLVANSGSNNVSRFSIQPDGTLLSLGPVASGAAPIVVTTTP